MVARLIALPRVAKRGAALLLDVALCAGATWLAFFLRLGEVPAPRFDLVSPTLAAVAISTPIFIRFGLYRAIFRYAGWPAIVSITQAVALFAAIYASIFTFFGVAGVPRTVGLIQPLLLLLLVASSRVLARTLLGSPMTRTAARAGRPRVLIYGAGSAGRQLASAILSSHEMGLYGFLDDDASLAGGTISGVGIHPGGAAEALAARHAITDVLLAIPSASRQRRAEILAELKALGLRVQTLPSVLDIARGRISIGELHEVDIEDLLGRGAVAPDEALMRRNIAGKVVMVTGAGGSIGQEICRQILAVGPATLLLVEVSEYSLYAIHEDLLRHQALRGTGVRIVPVLASVRDRHRIDAIVAQWRPDTIFHAAAYKHVPLVEHNVLEGIANNVFGTRTVAEAALRHGVASFVLISTDKAVRPTNVMGTTKRMAENVLQALAAARGATGGSTCFSMVRFGNVLGSSGSVVPLFRQQIASGGPITLTHADITRYFMTIPEAAQLVIQAGAMATGGDVFLLDMGEPVRIVDLARNMIVLSGLTVRDADHPDGDIEVRIVGMRPGEKLYEELLIGDNAAPSTHPRIMRANEGFVPLAQLTAYLDALDAAIAGDDVAGALALLQTVVPEYRAAAEIVDFTHEGKRATTPAPRVVAAL